MKTPDIFDLYTDYLITSFSYTTATGLSGLVDNAISHDPVTRFLSHAQAVKILSRRAVEPFEVGLTKQLLCA
jgi:hypothetical protein